LIRQHFEERLYGQLSVHLMTKDLYNKVKIVLFFATENFDFIQHG